MKEDTPIIITICLGSACFARGNSENLIAIERFIKDNNLNAEINLIGSHCEGNCSKSPNISIEYLGKSTEHNTINTKTLLQLLEEMKNS